jgi:hypothetical protein
MLILLRLLLREVLLPWNCRYRICDAGVTQNLPTLPKLTSLTVNDN